MENIEDMANADAESGDKSGVLLGDEELDELDESEDERHIDDDDCFGIQEEDELKICYHHKKDN